MFKRAMSILCMILLLSTTGVFAESEKSIIKPRVGGGTSEFWFYEHAYNTIVSRSELVQISYKLEKIERKESNMKRWKIVDIVSAVGGTYYGPLGAISLMNLETGVEREIRYGIEDVFRSLLRYPDSKSRFRMEYTRFYTETGRSKFTAATGCDIV